jgi:hypothetical protein
LTPASTGGLNRKRRRRPGCRSAKPDYSGRPWTF